MELATKRLRIHKWKILTTDYQDIHGWEEQKARGVIRCANAGFVLEKTLANRLADAFSKHLPAWQAKHNPLFSPKDSRAKHSRAIRSVDERCVFKIPVKIACGGI